VCRRTTRNRACAHARQLLAECRRDGDAGVIVVADNCTDGTADVARTTARACWCATIRPSAARATRSTTPSASCFARSSATSSSSTPTRSSMPASSTRSAASSPPAPTSCRPLHRAQCRRLAAHALHGAGPAAFKRAAPARPRRAGLLGRPARQRFALRREVLQALPMRRDRSSRTSSTTSCSSSTAPSSPSRRCTRSRRDAGRRAAVRRSACGCGGRAPAHAARARSGPGRRPAARPRRAAEPLLDLLLPPLATTGLLGALALLPARLARLIGLARARGAGAARAGGTIRLPPCRLAPAAARGRALLRGVEDLPAAGHGGRRGARPPWVRDRARTVRELECGHERARPSRARILRAPARR